MDDLLHDLRFAVRGLVRRPAFTFAVVATLALGIGANTAIFSLVNAVLLRALPYADADRLLVLWTKLPEAGRETSSAPDVADWQARTRSFTGMVAIANTSANLAGTEGEPERVPGALATPQLFPVLGIPVGLGRGFVAEDSVWGSHRVAVLSDALWRRRFGADPAIVGRTITINAQPFTVIGVAPPALAYPPRAEVWMPLANDPAQGPRGRRNDFLTVIARLAPGQTAATAEREMQGIMRQLAVEYPATNTNVSAEVETLREHLVGKIRPALLVFAGAVALVLLIACANVANLLLARATAREREMAVRSSLGAGRARLARQLLTESVVLSLAGGIAGLVLAVWAVGALRAAVPRQLALADGAGIDGSTLAFTLAISVVTGLAFGLVPALRLSQHALSGTLAAGGRAGIGARGADRMRGGLVLAQVALALVLLVGAGLLLRSFEALQRVELGFEPRNVLTARVIIPAARYDSLPKITAFFDDLSARVSALPGVRRVSFSTNLPLAGGFPYIAFAHVGQPPRRPDEPVPDAIPFVSDTGIFRTLGIGLVEGSLMDASHRAGTPRVIVVNEEFARKHFAGRSPIGERITFGNLDDSSSHRTIIGVVRNTRLEGVGSESYPQVYAPLAQGPQRALYLMVQASGDPRALIPAIRRAVAAIDPTQPVSDVLTMDERVQGSIAQNRVNSLLVTTFGALALLLAAIGIYAVLSYTISQRTREIGIRMALGAQRRDVLRLVVRQGMTPALLGIGAGLALALVSTRLLRSLLFGVGALDPMTFALVATVLGLVALVACLTPARRAAAVDPNVALRTD